MAEVLANPKEKGAKHREKYPDSAYFCRYYAFIHSFSIP